MTTLTIIRRLVTPKDSTKPAFFAYEYIAANGRKVDLRFKRDVNTSDFDGLTKFRASFVNFEVSTRFEYPRAYASGLVDGSIVDLITNADREIPNEYAPA